MEVLEVVVDLVEVVLEVAELVEDELVTLGSNYRHMYLHTRVAIALSGIELHGSFRII